MARKLSTSSTDMNHKDQLSFYYALVEHRGFPARLGQSCRQPGELKSHPPDAFLPCRAVPFKSPLLFTRNTKG